MSRRIKYARAAAAATAITPDMTIVPAQAIKPAKAVTRVDASLFGEDYVVVPSVDESHTSVRIEAHSHPSWCDGADISVTIRTQGVFREPESVQLEVSLGGGHYKQALLHVARVGDLERIARTLTLAVDRAKRVGLMSNPSPSSQP